LNTLILLCVIAGAVLIKYYEVQIYLWLIGLSFIPEKSKKILEIVPGVLINILAAGVPVMVSVFVARERWDFTN